MSKGKLSILVMRDDSKVKRMRVSPFFIRFCLYALIAIILVGAAGTYAGYKFWKDSASLEKDKSILAERLVEAKVKIERLENIENILKSDDPTELQTLLGSFNPDAVSLIVDVPSKDEATEKAAVGDQKTPQEPECPKIDLTKILQSEDAGVVSITNFSMKTTDKKEIVMFSFELANIQSEKTLAGDLVLFAISKDGSIHGIKAAKKEMDFSIQRYKQVSITAELPQDTSIEDVYGFRLVTNTSSGKKVFSEIYPISKLIQ